MFTESWASAAWFGRCGLCLRHPMCDSRKHIVHHLYVEPYGSGYDRVSFADTSLIHRYTFAVITPKGLSELRSFSLHSVLKLHSNLTYFDSTFVSFLDSILFIGLSQRNQITRTDDLMDSLQRQYFVEQKKNNINENEHF